MLGRITFVLFLSFLSLTSLGQNLVQNGGFEEYEECPEDLLDPALPPYWKGLRGTPDFFHSCNENGNTGIPSNAGGYQYPLAGEGYGGLISMTYNGPGEFLAVELNSTLEIGESYYLEFYWNRAFGGVFHANCDCANSHLGATFVTSEYESTIDIYFNNNPMAWNNYAHVYDSDLLVDSTGWNKISGWFVADSAYSHLVLGTFFDVDSVENEYFNGSSSTILLNTYYFIDNVCLSQDPEFCGSPLSDRNNQVEKRLKLFPNPAQNDLNIEGVKGKNWISIYDLSGRQIRRSVFYPNERLDVSDLNEGTYILELENEIGEFKRTKFIKR